MGDVFLDNPYDTKQFSRGLWSFLLNVSERLSERHLNIV